MGYRELIDSLRSEGEEKVRAIRQTTATEAARIEEESAARIATLREQYARRQEDAVAARIDALLARAAREQAMIRLEAENRLADRLYQAARSSLSVLRDDRYPELFAALARELLPYRWERVRVNPADRELARPLFPEAHIETDQGITGGMEVVANGGWMQIDNTLEKRLARGWPEMVPRLMDAIAREG